MPTATGASKWKNKCRNTTVNLNCALVLLFNLIFTYLTSQNANYLVEYHIVVITDK